MKGTTLILVVVVALTSGEDLSKKNPDKCSLRDEATMGVCLKRGKFCNLFSGVEGGKATTIF